MTELAIRLHRVTHQFGALRAVDDLSLDVPRGEIFGFIGPNGAGKTTTIRMIATLLEPTYGRVQVAGLDAVVDPSLVRRVLGYLPDHAGVYERITVHEYLDFFAQAAGVDRATAVSRAVELTGIGDWRERMVSALSKGMKQRLGLARVLLHDPQVLVLDEPASDLDPRARVEMRELFTALRGMGKTVFLSSHILSELADVCTSFGIIENGRLLASGPIGSLDAQLAPKTAHGEAPTTVRRVKIRILGGAEPHLPAVRAVSLVKSAETAPGGWLTVEHTGDEALVAELVKTLVTAGAAVVSVLPERVELERVFLEMTKGTDS